MGARRLGRRDRGTIWRSGGVVDDYDRGIEAAASTARTSGLFGDAELA
jgi:hypothetical protein